MSEPDAARARESRRKSGPPSTEGGRTRRRFARAGTVIAGGVVGASLLVPIVGFLASPLFGPGQPLVERRVGDVGDLPDREPQRFVVDFPEGTWSSQEVPWGLWVVRLEDRLKVFS